MAALAQGELQIPAGKTRGGLMTKKALLVFLFCCVVLSICPLMYGQANGSFSGTVSDKTGSVISGATVKRSEEHTSELQSRRDLVCRLLLEKKKNIKKIQK